MGRVLFATDNFYHIYNRGTEGRQIFLDKNDHFRFIHDLYEFNDLKATVNLFRRFTNEGDPISLNKGERDLLVDIVAFCLMPNHFHLVLRQLQDQGISKFLQKLGIGYTMYFNQKYERSGVLFQGRSKAIWVDRDEYLLTVCNYIHLNPVELIEPKWKESGLENAEKTLQFLKGYRWSSYLDYIGIKNFPSVTKRTFLKNYYADSKKLQEDLLLSLFRRLAALDGLKLEG